MAIAGRGWGKTTLDSESRARSNYPRLPWQTPRLTLSYWLTSTKDGSRSTATYDTSVLRGANVTSSAYFHNHDGAPAPGSLSCFVGPGSMGA